MMICVEFDRTSNKNIKKLGKTKPDSGLPLLVKWRRPSLVKWYKHRLNQNKDEHSKRNS